MQSRYTSVRVFVLALLVALSAAACGKYSIGDLRALMAFKEGSGLYGKADFEKAAPSYRLPRCSMMLALALAAALELAPGVQYDPRIPTLKQVAGHDFGEQISSPEQIAGYLQALAAAAPERVRVLEDARSWEGRPLHVIAIGGAERMARLNEIQAGLRRLADPRGLTPAEAERLVAELPTVTWLLHSVHGNEISSSDAALAEAYHLLSAQGDPGVARILAESIVLIDPLIPPEETDRFLSTLDREVAGQPVHVLVTIFWHTRSAGALVERYATPVSASSISGAGMVLLWSCSAEEGFTN